MIGSCESAKRVELDLVFAESNLFCYGLFNRYFICDRRNINLKISAHL
jgi:hypothetical protein